MKTAIQDIMDIVEMDYENGVEISMKVFYKMLKDGIEKEKEQIIKAVNDTFESTSSLAGGRMDTPIDGNDYYNETYKKD